MATFLSFFLLLLLHPLIFNPFPNVIVSAVGINYGTLGNNLPPPKIVAQLLQATLIDKAKIYDTNPEILQAFPNTEIDLIVAMENNHVTNIITKVAAADEWFATRVLPFIPAIFIIVIANLHSVLITRGLDRKIKALRQGSTERVPTLSKTKKQLMSSTPWRVEEEAEAEFPEGKLKVTSQPWLTLTMHVSRKKTKRSQDQDNQDSLIEINPEL
ncbi:hypothetical protein EV1_002691 [Malus domestica]